MAFTFASGTSLVLCMVLFVLWTRSYLAYDWFLGTITDSSHTDFSAGANRGRIEISLLEYGPSPQRRFKVNVDHFKMHPRILTIIRDSDLDDRVYWDRWGVVLIRGHDMSLSKTWRLLFPIWPGVVIAAGLPAIWIKTRRKKPVAAGFCTCGYNLAGNISGRCPECGNERIDLALPRLAHQAVTPRGL